MDCYVLDKGFLCINLDLCELLVSIIIHEKVYYRLFINSIKVCDVHKVNHLSGSLYMAPTVQVQVEQHREKLLCLLLIEVTFFLSVEFVEKLSQELLSLINDALSLIFKALFELIVDIGQ